MANENEARLTIDEDEDAPAPTEADEDEDEFVEVDSDEEIVDALREEHPEATLAECQRFARSARHGRQKQSLDVVRAEAARSLEAYLDWRSCYGLDYDAERQQTSDNGDDDAADWLWAVEKALGVLETNNRARQMEAEMKAAARNNKQSDDRDGKPKRDSSMPDIEDVLKEEELAAGGDNDTSDGEHADTENINRDNDDGTENENATTHRDNESKLTVKDFPQLVFLLRDDNGTPVKDVNGTTILHCLPGQVNRRKIDADTHANCFAFYLERKFNRNNDERMTIVIDTRPGVGWPNPLAFTMVNFVRRVSAVLQALYPERCERLVVYPLPKLAVNVWWAVRVFMQKDIVQKVALGPGPAGLKSPIPKDHLTDVVDADVLHMLDKHRTANFKHPDNGTEENGKADNEANTDSSSTEKVKGAEDDK